MTINELVAKAHQAAKDKGFCDTPTNVPVQLMGIVTEIAEAAEADRTGKYTGEGMKRFEERGADFTLPPDDPNSWYATVRDTVEDELAGAVIRIADLAGRLGIDLEKHIEMTMRFNKTRPPKHGGKSW